MAHNIPPHDAFPAVPDCAAILERSFTQDQCQSLQRLFLVHQSYLFRCLYEMETHLELTLEELKKKLVKTEGQTTRLLLLGETTRDGLITLSHRIDEIDSHQRRKRKRMHTTSSTHESEQATKQTNDLTSPVCSDTSTLLGGSPKDPTKNPSGSFLRALLEPINHHSSCDSDTSTNPLSSPQTTQNFASAPVVTTNLSPVRQWTAPTPENGVGSEPVSSVSVQDSVPTMSAMSSAHNATQPDPQPRQESDSEHEGTDPEPLRFQSHPQFPSFASDGCDDMDFKTPDEQIAPCEAEQDDDDDEDIVAMQLVNCTSCSTTRPPTPTPKLRVDSPDMSTPLASHSTQLPSTSPPPVPSLSTSPPPVPPLSPSPVQSQAHTPTPSPHQAEIPETHEQIIAEAKLEPQEPAPLTLDLNVIEPYFWDLTRSLSPLSDLSDMSSVIDFAEKRDDGGVDIVVKAEQASGSTFNLDGVASSDVLASPVVIKLEEKRVVKRRKTDVEKKRGRKRLDKRVVVKKEVTEQKKKSLKGPDKRPGKKRGRKPKVEWPDAYGGDAGDGFYKKLIECNSCACWYHYGCAGIGPEDVRLNSSEIFVCPVCTALGENKLNGRLTCSRPDCKGSEQPGEYYVSGIAGRKLRYDENGNVRFLYLVKWDGYSVADATWEFEDVMPEPQNLIDEFHEACRREGLPLDSSEPILLQEATAVGWKHVLEYTDPIGKQVPLEQHVRQTNGYRILIPVPPLR